MYVSPKENQTDQENTVRALYDFDGLDHNQVPYEGSVAFSQGDILIRYHDHGDWSQVCLKRNNMQGIAPSAYLEKI